MAHTVGMSYAIPPHTAAPSAATFADLSPPARAIWAKSGESRGHGLLAHMLDVAAVAEIVLARESQQTLAWAAAAFGVPVEAAGRWLAAMVGLHDLGKAIPGFQSKWPEGGAADAAAGLTFGAAEKSMDRHDLASVFELRRLLGPWTGPGSRAMAIAGAVAAHHGFVFTSAEVQSASRPGENPRWRAARQELFGAYMSTLGPIAAHGDAELGLPVVAWLAGLTALSDWIGSNTEWFSPGERHTTLSGHHAQSLLLAGRALQAIGWPAFRPLLVADRFDDVSTDRLIARIVGQGGLAARPLQAAADRLLTGASSPQLLIVEAPMGEGKTELALLACLRLQVALGHRGLFIGLPTQATGNAMFERTLHFLQAFADDAGRPGTPLDIQLAHGGVLLPDTLVRLRGIHGETGDNVRSSTWFSQRRRPLISPYGVGTLDQALLATLNVKHHFVRLWGLANRVVVLDEVHAYDEYTEGLIEALLRWLKAMRCSVVLMSATLPAAKRQGLLKAWGSGQHTMPDLPYPRVLVADDTGVRGEHIESRSLGAIELRAIDEDLQALADAAEGAARLGGCGAVIVNTVDRAQQLFRLLQERLASVLQPMLFHARFPAEDRQRREKAVLATFGRNAARPAAALLIATQVVEQSLDIDFDWLLSDLAPVDLLLQRAGRLHRHQRERPAAHAAPVFTIAGLKPERLPDLKTTRWGIYDEYILYRTWAFASRECRWQLPVDIDRMVQLVYGNEELPQGLDAATLRKIEEAAYGKRLAEVGKKRQLASNASLDARSAMGDAYNGRPRGNEEGEFDGLRNVTRLGPDSLLVVPLHNDGGVWRLHPASEPFDLALPPEPDVAHAIVQRQLRLSRHDVVKALRESETPAGWAEHPWLRHVKVVPLCNWSCTLGETTVRLDEALGIAYRTATASKGSET
jgi:CRISPR-associated endonuclease/helicase Cas3